MHMQVSDNANPEDLKAFYDILEVNALEQVSPDVRLNTFCETLGCPVVAGDRPVAYPPSRVSRIPVLC